MARQKVLRGRGERELLTDIRDLSTLFYVIFETLFDVVRRCLRRKSSEWLESSMLSNLGLRFVIMTWSLDLAIPDFAFLKHCQLV